MAVTLGNQRQGSLKITGLGKFKVLGFNLNKAQLEEIGVNLKEEPKIYSTREITQKNIMTGEETKFTVDVFNIHMWIELTSETVNESVVENGVKSFKTIENPLKGRIFRIMIPIENREWVSAEKGTKQWMNSVGKSSWAATPADLADWFKVKKPVYPALRGLSTLYDHLLAWTNIDITKEDSKLMLGESEEDIKSIFVQGDNRIIDELNQVCEAIKDTNDIHALIGVDGDYMQVYSGMILGETFNNKQAERLYNNAVGQYGFKGDFQNALMLQTYDPMAMMQQMTSNNNVAGSNENADTSDVTDLPF